MNAPSEDSDSSSLFHPSKRSSDELLEPGADGAGSSTYHALVPQEASESDEDGPRPLTFEDYFIFNSHSTRAIIIRPEWVLAPSPSSPTEISGSLPTTPFGPEPRVRFGLRVWPGPYVQVTTFIYARRIPPSSTSDSYYSDSSSYSPLPSPIPDSLPPSPPGTETDYAEAFLESGEGALDGIFSEAEAPSTTSQDYRQSCQSSAVGSAS
eukprot:2253282-Pleurochrysis_carterae.AAC.1